ncbi:MAG TPA: hypothetical protein VIM27_05000 [Gaiellales bacterium]
MPGTGYSRPQAVTPAATPREAPTSEGANGQNTTLFRCAKRGLTPFGAYRLLVIEAERAFTAEPPSG